MFTVVFIIAKIWIANMFFIKLIDELRYIQKMEYYLVLKIDKLLPHKKLEET